ncbi:nuclear transport factor 2 family protein [Phyllobacterium sp. YR531]|uniref:nuclear transport factor 2 family protein n=1 Tax=Phyllobacterium sp. YR531 TaxID=1144343 RepID=UPI00026F8FEF|nr:nuclear transport factor 2 family protein [Phyllobacterium sp. YR531]EJN03620.1 hypothetical protein PMI41_02329 [Phyllobacterium sp. YR531]
MPGLSKAAMQGLIENALKSMLDPNVPAEQLSEFFSRDYRQDVDGTTLDYDGFIAHAKDLKKSISSGKAIFEMMMFDGGNVADVHIIEATKTNGEKIKVKVIAIFTIGDGKITRVNELTHLLSGSPEDRNMGSRTSH